MNKGFEFYLENGQYIGRTSSDTLESAADMFFRHFGFFPSSIVFNEKENIFIIEASGKIYKMKEIDETKKQLFQI